jgi:ketosteroid isomerase-like protein
VAVSRENVELIRRGYETVARSGLGAMARLIDDIADPEIEFRAVGRLPDATPRRGREAMKEWFAQIMETIDFRVEGEEFIDAGDAVVVVTRQVAIGKASGAEATNRIVLVWGVREGKVSYVDAYRTTNEALEAVGSRSHSTSGP